MSLKHKVAAAIHLCEQIIETNDHDQAEEQIEMITAGYENFIPNMRATLKFYSGLPDDLSTTDLIEDIKELKTKLELLRANSCKPINNSFFVPQEKVEFINQNNANMNVSVIIDFNEIRREFENNGSLHQKEIDEIITKITEIEEIFKGNENNNKKWAQLKDTLNWLSTKGVDIAVKILPLILKSLGKRA